MSIKKTMLLVLAGPNGSGKSTVTQYFESIRIIRKHKEDISIFPNEYWPEDEILKLLE